MLRGPIPMPGRSVLDKDNVFCHSIGGFSYLCHRNFQRIRTMMLRSFSRIFVCAVFAAAAAGCARQGFDAAERRLIAGGRGGLMRVLTIADRGDSLFLRRAAAPLTAEMLRTEAFSQLCRSMLATVRNPANEGVGIAAPQVGVARRLVAVQRFDKPGEPFEVYVNPEIVRMSDSLAAGPEGCLSVPDFYGRVKRAQEIELSYRDTAFVERTETVRGYTAVIFQHEIDHLDGILYIDRLDIEMATRPFIAE